MFSKELNELATALAAAQGEFEAVAKTADNPFFKSKFAPLPEVVKAATPVLAKHGLSVSQHISHVPSVDGSDTLVTWLLHSSGQYMRSEMRLHLDPNQHGPQAQGSAVTYARRYSYMAVLGLVADLDDDGNEASKPAPKPAPQAKTHWRKAPEPDPRENRVGAKDAGRELIDAFQLAGWDELQARARALELWGDRGSNPIARGELSALMMAVEKRDE